MNKVKVLQVGGASSFGGIESFQLNLLRNINRKNFKFDFVVNNVNNVLAYEDEINKLGANVFYLPSKRQGYLKRIKILRHLLSENKYDVAHIHCGVLIDDLFLRECLRAKIKKIILHSHSSSFIGSKIFYLLHIINRFKYLNSNIIRLACSEKAGKWMHCNSFINNSFSIINNGIQLDKYIFDQSFREKLRKTFGFYDNLVIGHIARFSPEKNYDFIIKVFECVYKQNKKARLLLVGDGPLKKYVENKFVQLGLRDKVVFTGLRKDITNLLFAMDVFIFPSIHEGLPITLVEAQSSGLKCYISDNITSEVCLTDLVKKLPINIDSCDKWCNEILNSLDFSDRKLYYGFMKEKGFDIKNTAKLMEKIYLS